MNSQAFFKKISPTPLRYLTTINSKSIYIKLDYLNHPTIQGNKLRKLKFNLLEAEQSGKSLLSFGGAYSNHIAALAAASKAFNIKTIGIIRGDELIDSNRWGHTLKNAKNNGMQLHFVNRQAYREKEQHSDIQNIIQSYPNTMIIPEGGSNNLAIKGCKEIISEINCQRKALHTAYPNKTMKVFAACGTGGTLAGLIDGAAAQKDEHQFQYQIHGICVVNNSQSLTNEIKTFSHNQADVEWKIHSEYTFGGYAKKTKKLTEFIDSFSRDFDIPLDFVYTGKLVKAVWDLAYHNSNNEPENWLIYHSGGLQGIKNSL